ncbi:hypothetical protein NLY44_06800 [Mesorhizobium sp. C089B]|uniref:hypothetical protein n=1 Tax=Mesorhizobium sp. C089B TaxID=2956823 RepID=UPI0025756AAC|nr:hypothetical protein [Mesorhizobium sp. C089B]WJI52376.1 hypothetical protein NLY44_06800 [Mesorhizobium sp. C089B]
MSTPFNAFTLVEFLAFAGLSFLYVRADDSLSPRGKTECTIVAGILFAILVAARAPALLTFYRVWAEIGPLYFGYAYANGPLAALFNPASNYYDLAANLSSAVAVSAGLQWWPVVDTGSGLLVALLFPFVVAGTTQSISWRTGILLAVATALYCVTASETFGTALHIKGWGPVYAALVFGSLAFKQPLNRVHIGLLLVLPFTGTPAAFALIIWRLPALCYGSLILSDLWFGLFLDWRRRSAAHCCRQRIPAWPYGRSRSSVLQACQTCSCSRWVVRSFGRPCFSAT